MMSEKGGSPENDAKLNARLNIIQAIGNVHPSSPVTQPSNQSPSHLEQAAVSVDDVAKERQLHVTGVVKALQLKTPPSPSPKPRSPRQSPTNRSPVRQKKNFPERPPPPKFAQRKIAPDSPSEILMQRRPFEIDKAIQKPKPPVRTRKRKFIQSEDGKSPQPSIRQSEFVELSTSDVIVDCGDQGDGEIKVVAFNVADTGKNPLALPPENEVLEEDEEQEGEEKEEEAENRKSDNKGTNEGEVEAREVDGPDLSDHEVELDKDEWEVIPVSAASEETLDKKDSDESCLQPNGDTSKIENVIKSMSVKKKRPPPFRPPPYHVSSRTPPLPPKKKKSVSIQETAQPAKWNLVAEEVSAAASKQIVEEDDESQSQNNIPMEDGHIYEAVDENSTVGSEETTLRLLSRPENIQSKYNSFSSLDSDQSEGSGSRTGIFQRAGTMSEGGFYRREKSTKSNSLTRPKSEMTHLKDFETSFEVIPQVGSDLDSVMSSLRQADEKYQDASIYDLIQACSKALPHVTSTSELPSRLPDFPDNARAHVIHELYTTEYTYVRGLEVLCEVFRDTLSPLIGEETSFIFANVDDILSFNKGFLALLHSRLRELGPNARIGDIFIGMFTQAHKSMYAIYCSNYDSAEMHVTRLRKKKEFEQSLINSFSNNRVMPGLTLPAYLITPVQRIPRYILLLKDIIKHTPEDHPDRKSLLKAKETMGELADFIDAQVKESQTKKTFDALKNKVLGLADLDSTDRSLVKEGQVYLKNIKKLYQCILFNDFLVFAHGDSRQSKVELQLNLEAIWFEDLEDLDPQTSEEDAIEIYTPERPYTIYTRSSAEKRLWLSKLRDTIYHFLLKNGKCERSSTCNIAIRHSSFIYSDGRTYNGHFVDSRRHGKGTMTWPNKTVYVGDWIDDERCGEGELTYNTGEVYRGKWSDDKQNGYGELQFASNDVYRGHWKDGVRHGSGKIFYANGDRFEGHFQNGQIEGKGKLTCMNGVMYEGDWKHSQRHGKGKLRTATKNLYEGEFQYNHIHGYGTMTYENKDVYVGRWKNGLRIGTGRFESKLEGTYEGSWEDDLRHGAGRLEYPNGDVYEGGWDHNKKHLRGKMTFSTGMVYEGDFVNGVIQGEGEMRYSSNCKYQGSWINGLRHGSGAMVYSDTSSYNGDWYFGIRHGQGEYVMNDGSVYRGQWSNDKFNGKGTLSIPYINYTYNGDWINGKREGRGEETSQYGQYKGCWKGDLKHGYGEERSLVGTIFEGTWERGRKNGRGVRKMIFGAIDEQTWKSGQLISDSHKMTAVELPHIPRNDL